MTVDVTKTGVKLCHTQRKLYSVKMETEQALRHDNKGVLSSMGMFKDKSDVFLCFNGYVIDSNLFLLQRDGVW